MAEKVENEWINYFQTLNPKYGYNKITAASNVSRGHIGHKHSEETKRKIALSLMGNKNHFFGKQHTEETRQKISEKGRTRRHSQATRHKMSLANIGKNHGVVGENHPMFGTHLTDDAKRKLSVFHTGRKHTLVARKKNVRKTNWQNW